MLTLPVIYTLHLGEVNLILTALAGTDLLRRRDGGWWQGIATGIAAGIKFTPLIFIAYLAITRWRRVAAGSFAGTVAAGAIELPAQTRVYWLSGVFSDQNRVGNPANPSNQSLSGAVARLAGSLDAARGWWLAAEFVTALAGLAIAAWCIVAATSSPAWHPAPSPACSSPIAWTHHWVWAIQLLVQLAVTAVRLRSGWYGLAAAVTAVVFSALSRCHGPATR